MGWWHVVKSRGYSLLTFFQVQLQGLRVWTHSELLFGRLDKGLILRSANIFRRHLRMLARRRVSRLEWNRVKWEFGLNSHQGKSKDASAGSGHFWRFGSRDTRFLAHFCPRIWKLCLYHWLPQSYFKPLSAVHGKEQQKLWRNSAEL